MRVTHSVHCFYAPHSCGVGKGGRGCYCCSEGGGMWENRDPEEETHLLTHAPISDLWK